MNDDNLDQDNDVLGYTYRIPKMALNERERIARYDRSLISDGRRFINDNLAYEQQVAARLRNGEMVYAWTPWAPPDLSYQRAEIEEWRKNVNRLCPLPPWSLGQKLPAVPRKIFQRVKL